MGTFCLRNVYSKHLLFLATGTGIAPIKAILEDLSRCDRNLLPAKISLYWGCRLKSDIYWGPDYLDIDFDFKPVLSREHGSDGYMGYIQDLVVNEVKNFSDVVVYACGSSAMISQSQNVLCKAGLPQSSFYSDAFVASGLS
jgi:CDP-4-dehydro-6-deoxyglucose reductase, E3